MACKARGRGRELADLIVTLRQHKRCRLRTRAAVRRGSGTLGVHPAEARIPE